MPRVSVITAVRNGQEFLAEAIESILGQTFTDFEYIVVDDASTDGAPEIIKSFATADSRLITMTNPVALLPNGALNRALSVARGEYVAVLDADDKAMPERLALQVAFLDANPDVGAVGAQACVIDADGKLLRELEFPTDPRLVRWEILYRGPLLHSATTMRRSLVEQVGGYSRDHRYATDYSLFAELCNVTRLANLSERLVAYRRSRGQASAIFRRHQEAEVVLLIHAMLVERLGLRVCLDDVARFFRAVRGEAMRDEASLLGTAELLGRIHERYEDVERLDDEGRRLVRQDCAWLWLVMALAHRRAFRDASKRVLRRATALDPGLLRRPGVRARVRGVWTSALGARGSGDISRIW